MVSVRDIYASARLLIKRHGDRAWFEASLKSDELLANGDMTGAAVWGAICRAIEDLAGQRKPGEALH